MRYRREELRCVQNLVTMDVCELDLSSWNEVEVRLYVIEIFFKLRELTSAKTENPDL